MELKHPFTAAELATELKAKLIGDGTIKVTGLNEIHHVNPGDCCFVDHPKYYDSTLASDASVILIDKEVDCPPGKALLVTSNPFVAYNRLVWRARPQGQAYEEVQTIAGDAAIGPNTRIQPGAVIGKRVIIGKDCLIGPNAVIADGTVIGDRVTIGPGTVIGDEAFYFKSTEERRIAWRSGGHVLIENDVEIGANCTIARGVSSPTTIGEGTKIDALVQIGHDCRIGKHCLLAAQVGIAGNTKVGDWCVLLGQAGLAQNLTIGDRTTIGAKSGVSKDLEGGKTYFGYPAQEMRKALKEMAALRRLVD